jgi:hypothetical protein
LTGMAWDESLFRAVLTRRSGMPVQVCRSI